MLVMAPTSVGPSTSLPSGARRSMSTSAAELALKSNMNASPPSHAAWTGYQDMLDQGSGGIEMAQHDLVHVPVRRGVVAVANDGCEGAVRRAGDAVQGHPPHD